MTEIHSCSYYCDRPECVKAQRDELRERLAQPEPEPANYKELLNKSEARLHEVAVHCERVERRLKEVNTAAMKLTSDLTCMEIDDDDRLSRDRVMERVMQWRNEWDKAMHNSQPQIQPCAGRNCGSTNPNLHSAECFEDYEKSTRLAQPEQDDNCKHCTDGCPACDAAFVAAAERERLAQPEQEPFCYHDGRNIVGKEYADDSDVFPLYTRPQAREPLTEKRINELYLFWIVDCQDVVGFARAIERAAHGIGEKPDAA